MKLLLVEDDGVTRHLLAGVLRQAGHEVMEAADGDAGLAAFEASPVRMLLLDWQLPGLDGLTLCRRVRETAAGRHAFVLMLTSRDGVADLADAIDAGVDDYIVKPASRDHLLFRMVIAERRLAADDARRLAEHELEAARWRAGAIEAIVALQHEINNPLAALLTTLELATDEAAPPEEHREALETALSQTRRIVAVMRRVSEVSRLKSVEYVPGVQMLDVSEER